MAGVLQAQARLSGSSPICEIASIQVSSRHKGSSHLQLLEAPYASQRRKFCVPLVKMTSFLPPTQRTLFSKLRCGVNGSGSPKRERFLTVEMALSDGSNDHEGCNLEHDGHYFEASVVDAVCMLPAHGSLYMKHGNGDEVEVAHVNPQAGRLLYNSSTPTIFLRMANDSNLMLPIVVNDSSLAMVLKGLRNEYGGRPNPYDVLKEMVDATKHEIRMVKITQRVVDTYYARIFVGELGDPKMKNIDARPSDAINLAVRCKVPIFVNRSIVASDAVRIVRSASRDGGSSLRTVQFHGPRVVTNTLDRIADLNDPVFEEIVLVRSMMVAAEEERYADAARMRDELKNLRRRQETL